MKTHFLLLAWAVMLASGCRPQIFDPCQSAYVSIAYDADGWCFYDNPDFLFNGNTYCQSEDELLTVDFNPPYPTEPIPMVLRSKVLTFGCFLELGYMVSDPHAPPMSYTYTFGEQEGWSIVTIHLAPAVYTYLTAHTTSYVSQRLRTVAGISAWGQGEL